MMKPIKVKRNPSAINGKRNRVRSDEKARIRSMTAPDTFGATVKRFVLTVLYPNRLMMTGRNSDTDCSGTPRQTSIPRMIQLVGWRRTLTASRKLNGSSTTEEESICMR